MSVRARQQLATFLQSGNRLGFQLARVLDTPPTRNLIPLEDQVAAETTGPFKASSEWSRGSGGGGGESTSARHVTRLPSALRSLTGV